MNIYKITVTLERDEEKEITHFAIDDSGGEKLSQLEAVNIFAYLSYALKTQLGIESSVLHKCLDFGTSENYARAMDSTER